jgi:hypothetical protein
MIHAVPHDRDQRTGKYTGQNGLFYARSFLRHPMTSDAEQVK